MIDKPIDGREGGDRGGEREQIYESMQCVQEVNKIIQKDDRLARDELLLPEEHREEHFGGVLR